MPVPEPSIPLGSEIAFNSVYPIVEASPKPRSVGLTEVRTPAHSLARIRDYVDTLGPYLDSVKWTCGTQRLLTRSKVIEINSYLHSQDIEVSSGGILESVMPHGPKAVLQFLDESKELGFDIIEISSALVGISLADKCNIVKAVIDAGMKPKPEINAYAPGDRGHVNADKVIREAEAVLEAGAWKVMIEEDGIFSVANTGAESSKWNRDIVWRLASRISHEHLYWEASSVEICLWLLNSFGPDVNLFSGDEWLGYIAAFRSGAFVTKVAKFSL
ncbi:phosphosulfolactate synthase [Rhodococcus koreensis]